MLALLQGTLGGGDLRVQKRDAPQRQLEPQLPRARRRDERHVGALDLRQHRRHLQRLVDPARGRACARGDPKPPHTASAASTTTRERGLRTPHLPGCLLRALRALRSPRPPACASRPPSPAPPRRRRPRRPPRTPRTAPAPPRRPPRARRPPEAPPARSRSWR